MSDFRNCLDGLHRPRLLVRAARHGLADYRRDRDLRRLVGLTPQAGARQTLTRLMQEEARIEATRRAGCASYSPARHVDVLIALIAEARLSARPAEV